ncbi:MAG: F0F1 ATP synthase subunit A [Lactobacillaceae bacterium]|nr:F0F1 ATP synthase subunit A [Lactobacillaceae bacterium]
MANPMDQFIIKPLVPIKIGGFDISFTNSSLAMVLAVIFSIILLSVYFIGKRSIIPSKTQLIPESIYSLVLGIIRENAGEKGLKYSPFIFSIFLFVAFGNLSGLLPYNFTFTSHVAAVGTLAVSALLFNMFVGIKNKGFGYFRIFLPKGIPLALAPLVVPIETISLLSKPFSLTVRLVANMTVGHIMLKIIAGFVVGLGIAGVVPLVFSSLVVAFEVFIALIQTYIFTVLSTIYLSDAINGH